MARSYDEQLWEAADRHYGAAAPSGTMMGHIERPVPLIGEPIDGWLEYAVRVTFSEGRVLSAEVYAELVPYRTSAAGPLRWREVPLTGGLVTLDRDETESLEVEFAEREAES